MVIFVYNNKQTNIEAKITNHSLAKKKGKKEKKKKKGNNERV